MAREGRKGAVRGLAPRRIHQLHMPTRRVDAAPAALRCGASAAPHASSLPSPSPRFCLCVLPLTSLIATSSPLCMLVPVVFVWCWVEQEEERIWIDRNDVRFSTSFSSSSQLYAPGLLSLSSYLDRCHRSCRRLCYRGKRCCVCEDEMSKDHPAPSSTSSSQHTGIEKNDDFPPPLSHRFCGPGGICRRSGCLETWLHRSRRPPEVVGDKHGPQALSLCAPL